MSTNIIKYDSIECYTICSHCQSWPGYYTCSYSPTFVRDFSGKVLQPRECCYAYLDAWDKEWLAHPCPFFKGKIVLQQDGIDTELVVEEEGGLVHPL